VTQPGSAPPQQERECLTDHRAHPHDGATHSYAEDGARAQREQQPRQEEHWRSAQSRCK